MWLLFIVVIFIKFYVMCDYAGKYQTCCIRLEPSVEKPFLSLRAPLKRGGAAIQNNGNGCRAGKNGLPRLSVRNDGRIFIFQEKKQFMIFEKSLL